MVRKAFVCGWPVAHSRSPEIHRFWLSAEGIEGDYVREAVEPGTLPEFFASVRGGAYLGGNITLPHKEETLTLVDRAEIAAKAIGAVNTVWLEDGKLIGTNTDWLGFAENLDRQTPGWDAPERLSQPALVLGAGGAARGILYALVERGFTDIRLANRTVEKAEALAAHFGAAIRPLAIGEIGEHLEKARLLVNTTSLGMKGSSALKLDLSPLPGDAVVADIVYVPLRTELLKAAEKRGLRTADGLGMLLHQAVPGFERWFGVRPEVTGALYDLLAADITGKEQKS